ncbi:MAG: hypothetical protein ACYC35_01430 [Pirellulales bacterium]
MVLASLADAIDRSGLPFSTSTPPIIEETGHRVGSVHRRRRRKLQRPPIIEEPPDARHDKQIDAPPSRDLRTFKKAPKAPTKKTDSQKKPLK